LCIRVNPKKILEVARRLFIDLRQAHEVGTEASELLRQAYFKNKTALCGKKTGALIAAAIRLASKKLHAENRLAEIPTQRELAELCKVTEPTVRINERYLAQLLGLRQFLKQQSLHNWKLVSIIDVDENLLDVEESTLCKYVCSKCGKTKWSLQRKYENGRYLVFRVSEKEAKELIELNEGE